MSTKFKVGDIVRIVKNCYGWKKYDILNGAIGRITKISPIDNQENGYSFHIRVDISNPTKEMLDTALINDKTGHHNSFAPEELELYKPKLKKFLEEYKKDEQTKY